MNVKIVSTNPINRNRIVGYERGIEVKFDSELTAEVSEDDAEFLITIDDTLSIVGSKSRPKKSETAPDTGNKNLGSGKSGSEGEGEKEEFEDHIVTEEDMAEDPTLFERGIKVGDTIKVPKKIEFNEEQVKIALEAKSKTVLVEEFGETLGVTLSMKKEEIVSKILESLKEA